MRGERFRTSGLLNRRMKESKIAYMEYGATVLKSRVVASTENLAAGGDNARSNWMATFGNTGLSLFNGNYIAWIRYGHDVE